MIEAEGGANLATLENDQYCTRIPAYPQAPSAGVWSPRAGMNNNVSRIQTLA